MKLVKISAAVLNQTPLDWNGNRDRILAVIAAAQAEGVSILCLPERCISGYCLRRCVSIARCPVHGHRGTGRDRAAHAD